MPAGDPPPYAEAEIHARLARELPHWQTDGRALLRRYRTGGWRATLMIANAIGHLAELAWHHPELTLAYDSVAVQLSTHTAHGVTDKDFVLARKIEDLVCWQPEREGGPLEGLPADPQFVYLRPLG